MEKDKGKFREYESRAADKNSLFKSDGSARYSIMALLDVLEFLFKYKINRSGTTVYITVFLGRRFFYLYKHHALPTPRKESMILESYKRSLWKIRKLKQYVYKEDTRPTMENPDRFQLYNLQHLNILQVKIWGNSLI